MKTTKLLSEVLSEKFNPINQEDLYRFTVVTPVKAFPKATINEYLSGDSNEALNSYYLIITNLETTGISIIPILGLSHSLLYSLVELFLNDGKILS